MPLGTWGSFPSFLPTLLPALQDEALWIISTIPTSPFIHMEEPMPITSNNSPAGPSNVVQNARDLAMFAATVRHISVQDARSGDLGT